MSGLIEAVTERDLPRSRNTLDVDDEADAAMMLERREMDAEESVLRVVAVEGSEDGKAALGQGVKTLLVSVGKELHQFVGEACVKPDTMELVARVENGRVERSSPVMVSSGEDDGKVMWISCPEAMSLEECEIWELARAILGAAGTPQKVVVLDLLKTTSFAIEGRRQEPPLLRAVAATEQARQECVGELSVDLLESSNIVTGLAAAVLSEAMFAQCPSAFALLSLRESHMEADTLLALVDAVHAVLGPELVKSANETRKLCGSIQEYRGSDQSCLYI